MPLHLRNAPTQLMQDAGYGRGYRYLHDDPAAAREMVCLPPALAGRRYFEKREEHEQPGAPAEKERGFPR